MEKTDDLIGSELISISKHENGNIEIVFSKDTLGIQYNVSFKGYTFETKNRVVNHIVEYVSIGILGFLAFSELEKNHKAPKMYKQLFIKFKNENNNEKVELICAVKDLKISPKIQIGSGAMHFG